MRPILAWLLFVLISFQWIGGRLVYKVIYSNEITREMNEDERLLSAQLKARTGLEPQVRILDRNELDVDGIGYSNFFLFSEKMEGEEVFFEVNSDSFSLLQTELLAGPGSNPDEDPAYPAFPDRLFSDFPLQDTGLWILTPIGLLAGRSFSFTAPVDCCAFSTLVPPPERFA